MLTEELKIQLLDQPGCNDGDFNESDYCKFMIKCIDKSKGEMCANFLILINLDSEYLSPEESITIMNLAEILANSNYSFFPSAVIVFTHADKIDANLNENHLEQKLEMLMGQEEFENIRELIRLVEGGYMFINGTDATDENRNQILKKLFKFTRPNLNVYLNGNNGFKGETLKTLLGADVGKDCFRNTLEKYDVDYHFNSDLNIFRKYDKLDVGEKIDQTLIKLNCIGSGISVIIILISLKVTFTNELNKLILSLPNTYSLDELKFNEEDFWRYACILFKVDSEFEESMQADVSGNNLLREMAEKVKGRYVSVSDKTSKEECSEKILHLVKRVKSDTQGKTYIDGTVLAEMRSIMKESIKQAQSSKKIQMDDGVRNLDIIRDGIPVFKLKTGPGIIIKANNFFWSRKVLTPQIGYFILKNINPPKAMEFKEKYSKQPHVTTEEFAEFCLKAMKEL